MGSIAANSSLERRRQSSLHVIRDIITDALPRCGGVMWLTHAFVNLELNALTRSQMVLGWLADYEQKNLCVAAYSIDTFLALSS
jgi:hypothetical protein